MCVRERERCENERTKERKSAVFYCIVWMSILLLEIDRFECVLPVPAPQYYSESHSGRKLEWLFHLGHGEMYTHGFDKTYCIHSST